MMDRIAVQFTCRMHHETGWTAFSTSPTRLAISRCAGLTECRLLSRSENSRRSADQAAGVSNPAFIRTHTDECGKQPWYPYRNRIREVVVLDTWAPESGRYLFDGLTQCKSFDLLKLDTSDCTTLEGMFRGCSSVTELFDLDRLDTSNVENTSYMFLNCLALKAVSISGWETSKISDVNQMLSGCSTYILATEEQREFLNKITGSTQHGIWTRNLS